MTFTLLVWHEPAPISREQAAGTDLAGLAPGPAVAAFADEFGKLRPEAAPEVVEDRYARVTLAPENVDELSTEVFALARAHGLVCWDPERELVHNPGPAGVYEGMQLHTGDGLIVLDPDLGLIRDALARLGPGNPFAALVVFGRHFVQASPEEGGFELEYKDSVKGVLYRTHVGDVAEVQRAFQEYAMDGRGFLERHDWAEV
ncbi:hypothetical protein [Actinomadura macrotermitis]|uniref:EF-hand domain-containing protein n=1 Tax=Actinomadura macrotermitis TaxID=2585200 RepID=A0A7K0BXW6_9ACTN|nr:hypothetical protein [Actinomadura macrotermitis]MQY06023.1 hypothetical protein [Actinomadura macrotermitis]